MLKVNNKNTIKTLAKSSFKSNKMRNIFATIAIILTAILFTGLFTVAASLMTSMEESTTRQVGGSSHGGFKYLSMDQYDNLKTHPSIKDISYSVVLGIAKNPELAKRPTEIRYTSDETNAKGMFAMPTTGRLPQEDNEIATDTLVLERLGIEATLGQSLTLTYSVAGKQVTDTFTLVGYWQGDKLMQASQMWLSQSYVEKQLVGYVPMYDGDFIAKINADVNFSNSYHIEEKLQKVILDSGYTLEEIAYGVNWAYTGNSDNLDFGTIFSAVGAILMIIFCGYLMIANVFTINIAKDVRYYGLLKTIGTTGRQIKKMIRKQALWLCLVAVPIGLIIGYLMGMMLVPVVLSILNTNVIKMSVNPLIFILSTLFSIITVFVSIEKPARLACKVSPIEALRTSDRTENGNKKTKRSGKVNVFAMACNNLARNKKKAIWVTVSLSLGLVILNATFSLSNSFDMDEYLSQLIGSDFAVGDVSNFNVNIWYDNQDALNEEFFNALDQQEGIENVNNIYFAEPSTPMDSKFSEIPKQFKRFYGDNKTTLQQIESTIKLEDMLAHIYGLDEGAWERFTVFEGKLDLEKLATGKYIVVSPFDDQDKIHYYNIGDIVELSNTNGEMNSYEVLAIATIPYNISVKHYHGITPEYFLPSVVFLNQIERKTPMLTTINVEDSEITKMESFLNDYCNSIDPNMDFESKVSLSAEYEGTQRTFRTVGLAISFVVALVGIMNFANTIITSIISRKREFAMLQSVGMTNHQVKAMLMWESVLYIFLTLFCTFTLGSVICYLGLRSFVSGAMYMSLYFTVVPTVVCLPILLLIAIIVPLLSQKFICKSSIVERLRMTE